MIGQLAAIATAFCWSATAVFFSYSGQRIGSAVVNRSRLLFALAFISLTHLLLEGSLFPLGAEPFRWGWLGLSSVLGLVLGDAALFYAYVLIGDVAAAGDFDSGGVRGLPDEGELAGDRGDGRGAERCGSDFPGVRKLGITWRASCSRSV